MHRRVFSAWHYSLRETGDVNAKNGLGWVLYGVISIALYRRAKAGKTCRWEIVLNEFDPNGSYSSFLPHHVIRFSRNCCPLPALSSIVTTTFAMIIIIRIVIVVKLIMVIIVGTSAIVITFSGVVLQVNPSLPLHSVPQEHTAASALSLR